MGGEYSDGVPLVVAVGSASRDLTTGDPRGWRLGGGVTYGALALARAGLSVAVLIGVDGPAATAWELDLLREAGATVHLAPLAHGPVFENQERPEGRRQICHDAGQPLAVGALPAAWRGARGWLFAPVADELPATWARVPAGDACVALGWQGLLRRLSDGTPVGRRPPRRTPLLARADLVGLSSGDVDPGARVATWAGWLGSGRPDAAELVMTAGARGGVQFRVDRGGVHAWRRFPALAARHEVDATGAGDVLLAVLLATRLALRDSARAPAAGARLAVATAAASIVVEGQGMAGVPTLTQTIARMGTRR